MRRAARPVPVRRREPRPDLLRRGPGRGVPRRADRPGRAGRQGHRGGDAHRPGGDVLVPAERGQHRDRVPQPVLRRGGRVRPPLWPSLSDAGKCAMRWRGAIRIAARLRQGTADDQLKTLRYEDMARNPGTAADMLSQFTGAKIAAPVTPSTRRAKLEQNEWRRTLSYSQLADIEKVAGEELRRLGYRLSAGGRPPAPPAWEGFAPPCPPYGRTGAKTAAARAWPRPPLWCRRKARTSRNGGRDGGYGPTRAGRSGGLGASVRRYRSWYSWLLNWVRYRSAYRPPASSSSSCVPVSATWPPR